MSRTHTDTMYENELRQIGERFSAMGGKVVAMIEQSARSFFDNDLETAYRVIRSDDDVDRDDMEINTLCLHVIARRQPLGTDLRFVMAVQKSVTDLERMADLCVSMAERIIELAQQPSICFESDLKPMADMVIHMTTSALKAFEDRDAENSRRIILDDRMVDAHYAQLFRQLLDRMGRDGKTVSQATRILSILNNLERIGDHVKNIAEKTIYLVTGNPYPMRDGKKRPLRGILFLCVQNSARSQMAEGWAKTLLPPSIQVFSAGSSPAAGVNPRAVDVMAEAGVDISLHRPKRITDVPLGKVDMVVTLCSEEVCVNLPGNIEKRAWILPDPAADDIRNGNAAFIGVRDTIHERISALAAEISGL